MKLSRYSSYVLPVRPFPMCAYFTNDELITHTYSLRFVTPFDVIHLMHLIRVWLIGVCFYISQTKNCFTFGTAYILITLFYPMAKRAAFSILGIKAMIWFIQTVFTHFNSLLCIYVVHVL